MLKTECLLWGVRRGGVDCRNPTFFSLSPWQYSKTVLFSIFRTRYLLPLGQKKEKETRLIHKMYSPALSCVFYCSFAYMYKEKKTVGRYKTPQGANLSLLPCLSHVHARPPTTFFPIFDRRGKHRSRLEILPAICTATATAAAAAAALTLKTSTHTTLR